MMITGVNAGNAMKIGHNSIKKEVDSVQTESKAATFRHHGISDYKDKQLSPLQESIVKLQDQIANLKSNEKIDKDTKDELLNNLKKQLDDMMKLLNDPQQEEDENAMSVSHKKDNEQKTSSDGMGLMHDLGLQLDQVKSMGSVKAKIENQAKLEKSELDNAMNHPVAALRLTDESIIERRRGKIENMENNLHNLDDMMAEQAKKVAQPTVTEPSEDEDVEGKEALGKELEREDEKTDKSNLGKFEN